MTICHKAGLWVVFTGATLAALTVFAAFLPIDLGINPYLEPMPVVLDLAGAVCACGIALAFLGSRETVSYALSHPMVLAALFVAVWSAVVAPTVEYPWLSLLGAPVFGEAAVRYVCLAVFFAGALLMAEDRRTFRALCIVLTVVSFAAPLVMFALAQDYFVSLDLVGQFAVSGTIATWLLFPGCRARVRLLLALAVTAPALVLSSNHSVIAFMVLVGLPVGFAAHVFLNRNPDRSGLIRMAGLAAVLVAPFAGLALKWLLPDVIELPSIHSRHLLDKVLLAALQADPAILAFGRGWGAINLTVDSYILSADAVMWDGSWDLSERNISHSHSVYGEALFGAGLPAVAGVLAMFAAPLLVVKKDGLPLAVFAVVTLAGLSSVSAEFPSTVGAVALAFALAGRAAAGDATRAVPPVAGRALALAMPVLASALFVAVGWSFANLNEIRVRTADIYERGSQSPFRCAPQPYSAAYADIELARGLVKTHRPVFTRADEGKIVSANDLQVLDAYVCQAEARALESRSSSLQIALETFRGDLALAALGPDIHQRYARSLYRWPEKIARALNVAPQRVDLSKGFLVSQMAAGNIGTVESLAEALLERDPSDPIALWFLGLAKVRSSRPSEQADGWRYLRAGLDAGILRFFPIPEPTIKEVRRSALPK